MHSEETRIWIAVPSYLIRKSLVQILRQNGKKFRIQESHELTLPQEAIIRFIPDVLIIDHDFFPIIRQMGLRSYLPFLTPETKVCGILKYRGNDSNSNFFDKEIYLSDSSDEIRAKIDNLLTEDNVEDAKPYSGELSEREKEVLIELVKGFTNKEIGEHLNLSVHTVISHRKNITRKLDIKSSSGLTIYAIMNNLISIDEIKE